MSFLQRIAAIDEEIGRTQINKRTMSHICRLKARKAELQREIIAWSEKKGGGGGDGFDVRKSGDCRVALLGQPSVGKSSFLSKVTKTESAVASYEFTTLTCVPGKLMHKGTEIQLLDLPGIIVGASEGKGRGRQVIATVRTSDLVLMIMDAGKAEEQRAQLTRELENVGIRLNQRPANITFKKKDSCSMNNISFSSTVKLTKGLSEQVVKDLLKDYKMHNADVVIREDVDPDEFIDIIEGNRRYMPCLYMYNKIDMITIEEVARLAHLPNSVVCSVAWDLNIEEVIDQIWSHMGLIRIFTKRKGFPPDLGKPFVVKKGASIEHVCHRVHRDLVKRFKYALVWGVSAKHSPQRVGVSHILEDEDVVQIMVKTSHE